MGLDIIATNDKRNKNSIYSNIYFDTGKGFNYEEVETVSHYEQKYHFEIVLTVTPDVKNIRFDPIEGQCCILENIQIIADNGLINYSYTNGLETENLLVFDTYDPQIAVEFGGKIVSMVKISGEIYLVSSGDIAFLYKRLNNSKSWHTTKHLIILRYYIRRNKVLYMFARIFLSIKRNGIKRTLKKGVSFLQKKLKKLLQSLKYNSLSHECEYQNNIDFSEYTPKIKTIAFYLPQFHSIPENDEWWGKDFTEWTNTRKATPRFRGHYQPREPHDDFGYYNLTDIEVIKKQALLAKQHGIYGFCFYLYWFSGKRLLEKPLDLFIQHPEIDINFCLCWANENWTRRWDGQNKDILIKQGYLDDDPVKFIEDIKKYIVDKRYIRIDGIPVILVYNPGHIPNIENVFMKWRKHAYEIGIGKMYIFTCNSSGHTAETLGIEDNVDGMIEFPPHHLPHNLLTNDINFIGKKEGITAHIYDYKELVSEIKKESVTKSKNSKSNNIPVYRTCIVGWDNAARKKDDFYTFAGFSLDSFYEWASLLAAETLKKQNLFFFVNAWNEWGEGTYLEPDKKYGYAYINTLSKAICGLPLSNRNSIKQKEIKRINGKIIENGKIKICVQVHLHYMELINEIIRHLNFMPFPFHCYISTSNKKNIAFIENEFKKCKNAEKVFIEIFENRGRDVAPFICQMQNIINKYDYILHIHTKKSLTSDAYGDDWREYLFNHLLGSTENIYKIFGKFINKKKLGLIFPEIYFVVKPFMLWGTDIEQGKKNVLDFLKRIGIVMDLGNEPEFAAGNMFWARTKAIQKVFDADITQDNFPIENNQKDMTLAHAIERSWIYIVKNEGYTFKQISNKLFPNNIP
jgi:lipopolysaccharide biosynthesis protein